MSEAAARILLPSRGTDASDGWPRSLLWLAPIFLVSALFFHFNTAHGIGILTDSTRYMGISARPYDAPLYHWLLIFGTLFGLSLTESALLVGAGALAANVILVFLLLARASSNLAIAAIGTAMIVFSPQFVTLHASAMSEPPFLALLLLTIWFALDYFETRSRKALILSSLLLGLATLTRFAAPPLGAAIALAILVAPPLTRRRKWVDAALLASVGGVIFLTWVLFSQLTNGRSVGRDLWLYGNWGADEWRAAIEVFAAWILPDQFPLTVRLPLLILACGIAVKYMLEAQRRLRAAQHHEAVPATVALPVILGFFFLFYLLFLVVSVSLEANLALTGRYAFPAYVPLAMLLMLALSAWGAPRPRGSRTAQFLMLLAVIFCALQGFRSLMRTPEAYQNGIGYQHVSWRASPTIEAVRKLPRDASLVSNGPDIIAFHTGRPAEFSPHHYLLRTGRAEPGNSFERQVRHLRAKAGVGDNVYLILFDRVDWRHYLAGEARLVEALGLRDPDRFGDGRIYRLAGPSRAAPRAGRTAPPAGGGAER